MAYRVVWDNGASASGTFPQKFRSFKEADAYGREWAFESNVRDFGTPDPDEGYTYEVVREGASRDARGGHRRDSTRDEGGYHVMKYGGGRYTSVSWHPDKTSAEREVRRIKDAGAWSGMPPKIERGRRFDRDVKAPRYGNKRDYPKIEIFADGKYRATTTWARTLDEARRKFAESTGTPLSQIRAHYKDPRPRRGRRG